ncbi:MAG: DHH family phosphoesterase [Bacillota bacterium]
MAKVFQNYEAILDKVKTYDTIIIHRHLNPDLDALGSQLGLKGIINTLHPKKAVYCVGDENDFRFIGSMDTIKDTVYNNALAIVVDVAVKGLVSDKRYQLAAETLVIDHHMNDTDFADMIYTNSAHIATAQILADICIEYDIAIDGDTATKLMSGLVTDSGRFMYPATSAKTFKAAWFLMEHGADLQFIYDHLYIEDLDFKKLKGYFINNFETTKNNVAYMKNDKDLKTKYNVNTFTISRGMVNQMSGIKGIPMWANFTEEDNGDIICELRSKEIPIVDVAKKYGGGGHNLACGCTVKSWKDTDAILHDLDQLLEKEGESHG